MPLWDLATQGNWDLILAERRAAERIAVNQRRSSIYEYYPIAPFYVAPYSHTLLIGTQSSAAQSYWYLGARASQYLYVSPSMSSNFISGVQAADSKKCGLGRLTLIEFKNYDVIPYTLQLEIPYWLEDVYVEVWEYQGDIGGTQYEFDTSDIIERLQRIEEKMDIDNAWGNQ